MGTFITFLKQCLKIYIGIYYIASIPVIASAIEPIASFGQLPPEKHAFLTNDTLLRTSHVNRNIQIIDRDTGEIIDEFDIRPKSTDVVFSSNAKHLAIMDYSVALKTTTIKIWDVNTRKYISEWKIEGGVAIASFSPKHPILVTTTYNDEIYLWNWQAAELVGVMVGNRRIRKPCYVVKEVNGNGITQFCSGSSKDDMAFTPDGKYLIVASKRPDIELWNVETRKLVGHFEGHTGNWVDGVAISPNGAYMASFENRSNMVYMWDIDTRQLLWKEPIDDTGISDMVFSPNNQHLYAADKNVYIWDVKSGQQVNTFGNDYFGLEQMILSPDGKTMLLQYSGGYTWGGVVELWNTETRQRLRIFADFIGGEVRLSPDGKTMVNIDSEFIKVWDIPSQQLRFLISGVYFFDKGVAISQDNKRIAYSRYTWVEVADIQNGNVEVRIPAPVGYLKHAKFSRSGRWLATVDGWGYLFFWDLILEERQWVQIDFNLGNHDFYQVAFSKNDEYMAASLRTGQGNNSLYWILLWKRNGDNFEFQYRWETPEHSTSSNSSLVFASTEDGSTMLAAAGQENTEIWKILPQNALLVNTLMGAKAPIYFSPNKRYLFTNKSNELQIWDWEKSRPINFPSIPNYKALSEDGSVLVSSDAIDRYLIWDAKDVFSSLPYSVEPKGKQIVTLGQIKRDQLLQNYPNPFNPETWIPFRLANKSSVAIHIYTQTGKLVRSLSPGIMSAGDYSSQSNALHWDGRNEKGESVSSGVYLYTINAGGFSDTRKMLIRK